MRSGNSANPVDFDLPRVARFLKTASRRRGAGG